MAVLLIGVPVYATSFVSSLPDVHGLDATGFYGDTIVYANDGKTQLADIGIGGLGQGGDRRQTVTLDQVSPKLVDATVAIEDRTFWKNSGFDTQAILRTALNNFRAAGITGGASTITQQLAKRLFLLRPDGTPDQSFERKVKEIILAYDLSKTYSKRQILELYLNETYYGDEAYGVQAASLNFFNKPAKNLDLAQAAMLAGLPQAPDGYNPASHLSAAKVRQKEVLDAMVRDGKATSAEAAAAYREHLDISSAANSYKARHFVQYVVNELKAIGFKPGQQQLIVKTTLDYGKQQLAEQLVRDNRTANASKDPAVYVDGKLVPGELQSSLVAMDPKTGQIVAYVGSASSDLHENGALIDYVSDKPINVGSSLKPITYAAAIRDRKITVDTPIADNPSPYVVKMPSAPDFPVRNFDNGTHGTPPARVALASSLNIPAVKVELAEGVPAIVDMQRSLGLHPRIGREDGTYTTTDPNTSFGPSLTLGGYPITLLEEAAAYGTFATLGTYHQPEAILQVTDTKGRVLYQADPNRGARPNAIDKNVAFIINSILVNDNNRALIFGHGGQLHLPDRHSAAKSGTTNDDRDGVTVGWTPDLVTAVWIGDIIDIHHHMVGSRADSIYVATPLWHDFMEKALKGVKDTWYQPTPGVSPQDPQATSYFLAATPKVDHLLGDSASPSPTPGQDLGIPPDPHTGPQPIGLRCRTLPIPLPICPSPTP